MANPNSYEQKSADLGSVILHVEFPTGATGAVGTIARQREFIAGTGAVVRQSAGVYRLFLKERWQQLLNCYGAIQPASFLKTAGTIVTLSNDQSAAATPFVEVTCRTVDGNGAAADPGNGDTVMVTLELQNIKV